jgi:hypothetical protein
MHGMCRQACFAWVVKAVASFPHHHCQVLLNAMWAWLIQRDTKGSLPASLLCLHPCQSMAMLLTMTMRGCCRAFLSTLQVVPARNEAGVASMHHSCQPRF